jgi:hypothetical protein
MEGNKKIEIHERGGMKNKRNERIEYKEVHLGKKERRKDFRKGMSEGKQTKKGNRKREEIKERKGNNEQNKVKTKKNEWKECNEINIVKKKEKERRRSQPAGCRNGG